MIFEHVKLVQCSFLTSCEILKNVLTASLFRPNRPYFTVAIQERMSKFKIPRLIAFFTVSHRLFTLSHWYGTHDIS